MSKGTLHVVALPHTVTSKEFLPCAYTQKVLNYCRMMQSQDWRVIHYGTEGSTVTCEHVDIITREEQRRIFGEENWRKTFFNIEWNPASPHWSIHNHRASEEIRRRLTKGDFLCVIAGGCQKPIADALPGVPVVEWGIGYAGVFANFRVFESYAWMHAVLASIKGAYGADGHFYDCVIPNSFPAEDFSLGKGDGGYAFYIGRLIRRKGLQVAIETCQAAGVPLKIAGQGGELKDGKLHFDGIALDAQGVEYVGTVDVAERNRLMGGAIATFVPTFYLEPFGGVAVESQMCGTPVITTDWGAMTETVAEGESGYHCHTLGEFVWALRKAPELDRAAIAAHALATYSCDAVAPRYDRYFRRLADLNGKGWYTVRDTAEV